VRAGSTKEIKKKGRPKKIIRNLYESKDKPKNFDTRTHSDVKNEKVESDIEANLIEIIEPQSLTEALNSPQANE
jgi:hypothetical protein